MECDMEIEDESPEASGMEEEATPPISVAPPIPVPPVVADRGEGQKVDQALLPTTREAPVEEDNEPLPPGVEDDEPLPPGIEAATSGMREIPSSGANIAGEAGAVSQEPGNSDRSAKQTGEWGVRGF